jgi:hypothetical protein
MLDYKTNQLSKVRLHTSLNKPANTFRSLTVKPHHYNIQFKMGFSQGGSPRPESLLRKSRFWLFFPIKLVKYSWYSPQIMEKCDSNQLFLATAFILRQPPSKPTHHYNLNTACRPIMFRLKSKFSCVLLRIE